MAQNLDINDITVYWYSGHHKLVLVLSLRPIIVTLYIDHERCELDAFPSAPAGAVDYWYSIITAVRPPRGHDHTAVERRRYTGLETQKVMECIG